MVSQDDRIGVLIADDDEGIRVLIGAMIAGDPSLHLTGTARDTPEAVQLVMEEQPDVVLLDLDMPGGGGWKAAEEIADKSPHTQVIVLTGIDTAEARLESARAGVVEFLPKGLPSDEIIGAIRRAVHLRVHDAAGSDSPGAGGPDGPGHPGYDQRIAQLEERVASLEQSLVKLISRD